MWRLCVLFLHLLHYGFAENNEVPQWQYLIPKNYSKAYCSSVWDLITLKKINPTSVDVFLQPLAITRLSLRDMDFKVELNLNMRWSDSRLNSQQPVPLQHVNYDLFQLPREISIQLWHPEAVFRNCKECAEELIDPMKHDFNVQVNRISVHYRSVFNFNCFIDLARYPFDSQFCHIELELNEIRRHVNFKYSVLDDDYPKHNIMVPPEYTLKSIHTLPECKSQSSFDADKFNCITYIFELRRIRSQHVVVVFIPSILIVILSWLSFWMDLESMFTTRLGLTLTCLLILIMQMNFAQRDLPADSVVKSSDLWILFCVFFVLAVIVESAVAKFSNKKQDKTTLMSVQPQERFVVRRPQKGNCTSTQDTPSSPRSILLRTLFSLKRFKTNFLHTKIRSIDHISKIAFPLLFFFFNLVYWPACLAR